MGQAESRRTKPDSSALIRASFFPFSFNRGSVTLTFSRTSCSLVVSDICFSFGPTAGPNGISVRCCKSIAEGASAELCLSHAGGFIFPLLPERRQVWKRVRPCHFCRNKTKLEVGNLKEEQAGTEDESVIWLQRIIDTRPRPCVVLPAHTKLSAASTSTQRNQLSKINTFPNLVS